MARAYGALSLDEEKHLVLAKAHRILAAKCRLQSVEETQTSIEKAFEHLNKLQVELEGDLSEASTEVYADRATMLVVLSAKGDELSECSPDFRNDPEMVLAACPDAGSMFDQASPELRGDRDFMLKAVKVGGGALQYASAELQGDREVVLTALESNPLALRHASDELRRDRDLILASLRLQTRRDFLLQEQTVLPYVVDAPVSDKEIVLEAARLEADALAIASVELRQDKDFVLEVMRRVPVRAQKVCYNQASAALQGATKFKAFQSACNSVLASKGEAASVLTIKLTSMTVMATAGSRHHKPDPPTTCEVSLLSGTTFTCSLLEEEEAQPSSSPAAGQAEQGPQSKRRRVQQRKPAISVGRLANLVRAELLKQTKADPPPARIFLVFAKRDAEGEDQSIPVSPWDWNRPVTDFC